MALKYYHTVDGELIGETSSAGVRTDYLTDSLGSVTATVDSSAAVINTYRYKPYGGLLAKTGAGADPNFLWCGTHQYRKGPSSSLSYVYWPHVDSSRAAWTTPDSLSIMARYVYAGCNPVTFIDDGQRPHRGSGMPSTSPPIPHDPTWDCKRWNEEIWKYCHNCYWKPIAPWDCQRTCDILSDWYYNACGKGPRVKHPCEHWIPVPKHGWDVVPIPCGGYFVPPPKTCISPGPPTPPEHTICGPNDLPVIHPTMCAQMFNFPCWQVGFDGPPPKKGKDGDYVAPPIFHFHECASCCDKVPDACKESCMVGCYKGRGDSLCNTVWEVAGHFGQQPHQLPAPQPPTIVPAPERR